MIIKLSLKIEKGDENMSNGFNSKIDMEKDLDDMKGNSIKEVANEAIKLSKEINQAIKGNGLYDSRNTEIDFKLENQIQDMRKEEERLRDIRDREESKEEKEFEHTKESNKQEKNYDYDMER